MQENELHKLGKTELLTIIYEQEKQIEQLKDEIKELNKKLENRTITIQEAGSIADASLKINKIFEAAQQAADEYLRSIKEVNKVSQENAEIGKAITNDKESKETEKQEKNQNKNTDEILIDNSKEESINKTLPKDNKEIMALVVVNRAISVIKPKLLKRIAIFFIQFKNKFIALTTRCRLNFFSKKENVQNFFKQKYLKVLESKEKKKKESEEKKIQKENEKREKFENKQKEKAKQQELKEQIKKCKNDLKESKKALKENKSKEKIEQENKGLNNKKQTQNVKIKFECLVEKIKNNFTKKKENNKEFNKEEIKAQKVRKQEEKKKQKEEIDAQKAKEQEEKKNKKEEAKAQKVRKQEEKKKQKEEIDAQKAKEQEEKKNKKEEAKAQKAKEQEEKKNKKEEAKVQKAKEQEEKKKQKEEAKTQKIKEQEENKKEKNKFKKIFLNLFSKKKKFDPKDVKISLKDLEKEIKRRREKENKAKFLRTLTYSGVVIIAFTIIAATRIFYVLQVSGNSMEPSLYSGDILIVSDIFGYKKGDMIAFYYSNSVLIKRVIATEGDIVYIDDDGKVYVNSEEVKEDYIEKLSYGKCDITFPYKVPDKEVFVLGDNRESSIDSRSKSLGAISEDKILGKIMMNIKKFIFY